jgi:hypothetical protein
MKIDQWYILVYFYAAIHWIYTAFLHYFLSSFLFYSVFIFLIFLVIFFFTTPLSASFYVIIFIHLLILFF